MEVYPSCPPASLAITEEHDLRPITLVWVDPKKSNSEENVTAQQQIRSIIKSLVVFRNNIECVEYFNEQQSSESQFILVVDAENAFECIPQIHHLPHLKAIYIYPIDPEKKSLWLHVMQLKVRCQTTLYSFGFCTLKIC